MMTKQIATTTSTLAYLILAACLGGCQLCQTKPMILNQDDLAHGLVIVLPGIDGRTAHDETVCQSLSQMQPSMAVELVDWTAPLGPVFNQCAMDRNRAQAAAVAGIIVSYRTRHPGQPVFLIGHSGETAIAIWAAEALPADQTVDGLVLLASSLSPEYDLSAAMAHTRRGIVNFCSERDSALLGAGTAICGTMDRKNAEAAGKVGFHAGRQSSGAGSLFQIHWTPAMLKCGHDGGHFGYTAPGFISQYVAPLLAANTWSQEEMAAVTDQPVELAAVGARC